MKLGSRLNTAAEKIMTMLMNPYVEIFVYILTSIELACVLRTKLGSSLATNLQLVFAYPPCSKCSK